jgi:hypothetical protein
MNKYTNRLLEEWKQHSKIVIAVDFDDTISIWRKDFNKEDIYRTIELLKKAYVTGAHIVIFTVCNTERYEDIEKYCNEIGINISSINKNPINLPYGMNGKIYANIFLDDRAGLTQALDILEEAMYNYRGHLQNNKQLNELG